MRVGIVRTDMGRGLHIDDLMSRNQHPFDSSVAGQARSVRRPTDAELSTGIATKPAPVSVLGTNTSATVDTTTNKTLRIRHSPANAYTVITVTSGAATAKTTIRDDLNAGFASASLPFTASIFGTNKILIKSTGTNTGPSAYLQIDTTASGSNLNTAVGFAAGGTVVNGTSAATLLSAFKTAAYPTATTIDVSEATVIAANADWSLLSALDKTALTATLAELVAPKFIETGDFLHSLTFGKMSKMRLASFQPGGTRAGHAAGKAIAAVLNDGVSPFVFP